MPCEFSDISKLSASEKNAVINACELNLMGVHKDGILVKRIFEPNVRVSYNEAATVISRLLWDGKFNLSLNSLISWYQPHVTQLQKI